MLGREMSERVIRRKGVSTAHDPGNLHKAIFDGLRDEWWPRTNEEILKNGVRASVVSRSLVSVCIRR